MSVEAGFSRRSFRSPGSPTWSHDVAAGGGGKGQQSQYGQSGSQTAACLVHHRTGLVANGAGKRSEAA